MYVNHTGVPTWWQRAWAAASLPDHDRQPAARPQLSGSDRSERRPGSRRPGRSRHRGGVRADRGRGRRRAQTSQRSGCSGSVAAARTWAGCSGSWAHHGCGTSPQSSSWQLERTEWWTPSASWREPSAARRTTPARLLTQLDHLPTACRAAASCARSSARPRGGHVLGARARLPHSRGATRTDCPPAARQERSRSRYRHRLPRRLVRRRRSSSSTAAPGTTPPRVVTATRTAIWSQRSQGGAR